MRKVYEQLYRDAASAIDALTAIGFQYTGPKGLIQKHHSYRGVVITELGGDRAPRIETLNVKLFDNGLVRIFVDPQETSLLGMGAMPDEHYRTERQDFENAQMFLRDVHSGRYTLQFNNGSWCVIPLVMDQSQGFKVFGNAEPEKFTSWRDAFKFAKEKAN
jgi:hypothetical protein